MSIVETASRSIDCLICNIIMCFLLKLRWISVSCMCLQTVVISTFITTNQDQDVYMWKLLLHLEWSDSSQLYRDNSYTLLLVRCVCPHSQPSSSSSRQLCLEKKKKSPWTHCTLLVQHQTTDTQGQQVPDEHSGTFTKLTERSLSDRTWGPYTHISYSGKVEHY